MEAFFENDLAVLPLHHVAAEGIGDFATISLVIKYFKEKIVAAVVLDHEWVGNETGIDVCNISCAEYRVAEAYWGKEPDR